MSYESTVILYIGAMIALFGIVVSCVGALVLCYQSPRALSLARLREYTVCTRCGHSERV